jgi:hypothetical protein
LLTGVGLFAGVGVSLIVVFGILRSVEPTSGPPAAVFTPARGGPRLEVSPSADRDALQSQAQGRLHDYGWTDRTAQIAHIPIDRAMAILAARGWPDPDNGQESRP